MAGARRNPAKRNMLAGVLAVIMLQPLLRFPSFVLGGPKAYVGAQMDHRRRPQQGVARSAIWWPSAEAEAELRQEQGVLMLPTHKWKEGMLPVIHASRSEDQWDYPPWNKIGEWPLLVGIVADTGSGATTFIQRIMGVLKAEEDPGHTLVGDIMTVINLDDYRINDKEGCESTGHTPLDLAEVDVDLMRLQIPALKEGKAIYKPVYDQLTGLKEMPELVEPNKIMVLEGLHPLVDEQLRKAVDLSIYIDIPHEMKYFWKSRRDVEERGMSAEQLKKEIEKNRDDYNIFVAPQAAHADIILRYTPSDRGLPYLKVELIQVKRKDLPPVKLTKNLDIPGALGVTLKMYEDTWFSKPATVLEMDGAFDHSDVDYKDEIKEVESHLTGLATKSPTELDDAMRFMRKWELPGSYDGTGLFQTIVAFKLRELFEKQTESAFE